MAPQAAADSVSEHRVASSVAKAMEDKCEADSVGTHRTRFKSVRSSVLGSLRPSQCLSRRDRLLARNGGLGLPRTKRP